MSLTKHFKILGLQIILGSKKTIKNLVGIFARIQEKNGRQPGRPFPNFGAQKSAERRFWTS